MFKSPEIIGHRGACGYAPENTASSIHTAADMGVEWVEVDVKLTKDQVPILFHDEELDRITNGSGFVKDHTWDEIKDLDAGSWFSEGFAGEPILSFEECIEILIQRNLGLNLEIKGCPEREIETAEVALDMLSSIWDDHNRLLITSYSPESLQTSKHMAQGWKISLVLGYHSPEEWLGQLKEDHLPEQYPDLARALNLEFVSIDNDFVTPEILEQLNAMEIKPIPYAINNAERARELQGMGVSVFISDEPDTLIEGLFSVH